MAACHLSVEPWGNGRWEFISATTSLVKSVVMSFRFLGRMHSARAYGDYQINIGIELRAKICGFESLYLEFDT